MADQVKTYQRLIQRLERDKASPDIISACKERLTEALFERDKNNTP